jgi:hypothetical protein
MVTALCTALGTSVVCTSIHVLLLGLISGGVIHWHWVSIVEGVQLTVSFLLLLCGVLAYHFPTLPVRAMGGGGGGGGKVDRTLERGDARLSAPLGGLLALCLHATLSGGTIMFVFTPKKYLLLGVLGVMATGLSAYSMMVVRHTLKLASGWSLSAKDVFPCLVTALKLPLIIHASVAFALHIIVQPGGILVSLL